MVYIDKLQDIRNVISAEGHTLLRCFFSMTCRDNNIQLIHSIHNMDRPNSKVALMHAENYAEAVD